MVLAASGCAGPAVSDIPATGRLTVEVYVDSASLGQYSQFEATWAGQWTSGAAAGGVTSAFDVLEMSAPDVYAHLNLITFPERDYLRQGNWQISMLLQGFDSTGSAVLLDTLCSQTIYQDKTLVVRFTEPQAGCTAPLGTSPPPG